MCTPPITLRLRNPERLGCLIISKCLGLASHALLSSPETAVRAASLLRGLMAETALPNVANVLFGPEPASPAFMLEGDLDVFARDLLMQAGSNADWALPELDMAGIPVRLSAALTPPALRLEVFKCDASFLIASLIMVAYPAACPVGLSAG